jgi:hypothetical protein
MTRITDQNKLIVTGLGNSTVEAVDLGARRVVQTITGQNKPQAACVPELQKLFICNGGGETNFPGWSMF